MKASRDTWMPWYIGDALAGMLSMNADEDGAYRRLIDACWMAGGVLTEVNETFAIITKLGMERWLAARPIVAAKFRITGKEWRHERVTKELEKTKSLQRRARTGGIGRAAKAARDSNGHFAKRPAKRPANGQLNGQLNGQPNTSEASS